MRPRPTNLRALPPALLGGLLAILAFAGLSTPALAREVAPRAAFEIGTWAPKRIPRLARKELVEHARSLGIAAAQKKRFSAAELAALDRAVVAAETNSAIAADPRTTPALVESWMGRFAKAQALHPPKTRVLFGFTRMIDAKLPLSTTLFERLGSSPRVSRGELDRFLVGGPRGRAHEPSDPVRDEKWGLIDTPEKLLAAILRHQVSGEGASLQLQIDENVSRWLRGALEESGTEVKRAVGGAAAFGANLAAAFPGVEVSFHSAQPLSVDQARGFGRKVRVVTPGLGGARGARALEAADEGAPTKVNYIVELPPGLPLTLLGARTLAIGSRTLEVKSPSKPSRIILSTNATYPPTFDPRLGEKQIARIARRNDLFVMVGLHYLTGYDAAELDRVGETLRGQLRTLRRANPDLVIHHQYVRAKDPSKEAAAFAKVAGLLDSLSLNATELGELVQNLDGKRLLPGRGPARMPRLPAPGREAQEDPSRLYRLGSALLRALDLERLHIHGFDVDLVLVRGGSEARLAREGLAAMKGRALGVNKVVGESGEIRSRRDLWKMVPTVKASGVAALQGFADFVAKRDGLDARTRDRIVWSGRYLGGRDGVSVSITPTRQFHSSDGGLVSLGDTIDITTLLSAR
jgi:ADP-dependent phosphofructokinase/glucokinase